MGVSHFCIIAAIAYLLGSLSLSLIHISRRCTANIRSSSQCDTKARSSTIWACSS